MDRTGYFTRIFTKKIVSVISMAVFLLPASRASVASAGQYFSEVGKHKIIRQVFAEWMGVAREQYRRAYFTAAKESLLRAQEYRDFLTIAELEKLSELSQKSHEAAAQRQRVLKSLKQADEMIERNKLLKAKVRLATAESSEYLTKQERKLITQSLAKIQKQLNKQKKQITAIYKQSVSFFKAGEFEKARIGFAEVTKNSLLVAPLARKAEDYLNEIDGIDVPAIQSPWLAVHSIEQETTTIIVEDKLPVEEDEPKTRKARLLRSYFRAVVKDDVEKAKKYVDEGRFYKAKVAVGGAAKALNENRQYLGQQFSRRYHEELEKLTDKIAEGRARWLGESAENAQD